MNLKTILALSLIANLLLGFAVTRKGDAPTVPPPAIKAPDGDNKPAIAAAKAVESEKPPVPTEPSRTFGWEAVESADYKEYIANLRSIGCPEETIRDIINADVSKLYTQKRKAAEGPPKEYEFWKAGNPYFGAGNSEKMELAAKMEKEKNDMLRSLGIEPDARASAMSKMMNPVENMLAFLSEDKKNRVLEKMTEYQSKMAKATEGGRPDPEVIGKVQKAMEADIATLLTEEENFGFEMRFSITANTLRQSMGGFEPSKDEFLKLYDLRKEFDEEHSIFGRSSETPEKATQRKEDEKVMKEAVKASLGEERYADYEMSQDYKFKQAHTAATRSGLGVEEAKAAWEMRKEAEKQATDLRKNKELEKVARDAALAAIRAETEASIKGVYGEDGWENYRRGNGHSWLDRISKVE
jgi:hypothetical protein